MLNWVESPHRASEMMISLHFGAQRVSEVHLGLWKQNTRFQALVQKRVITVQRISAKII